MTDSVVIRAFECPSKCSNSSSQREDSPIRTAAYPLGCTAIGKPHLAASSHQLILPEAVAKISAGPTRGATPLPAPCMEASNSLREASIEKCHGCHSPDFHRPIIPAPPDHSRAPTRRSCGGRNPRNLNHAKTHPPLARLPRHPRHSRTPYHPRSPRPKRRSPPPSTNPPPPPFILSEVEGPRIPTTPSLPHSLPVVPAQAGTHVTRTMPELTHPLACRPCPMPSFPHHHSHHSLRPAPTPVIPAEAGIQKPPPIANPRKPNPSLPRE